MSSGRSVRASGTAGLCENVYISAAVQPRGSSSDLEKALVVKSIEGD